MNREKILETFEALRAAGSKGLTIDGDGNQYEADRGGYAVGFKNYDNVEVAINGMEPGLFLGYWVAEDGREHADLVTIHPQKWAALVAALIRGEIAVYDFSNDSLIYVGDVATTESQNHEEEKCAPALPQPQVLQEGYQG